MALEDQISHSPFVGFAELKTETTHKSSIHKLTFLKVNQTFGKITGFEIHDLKDKPLSYVFPELLTDASCISQINKVFDCSESVSFKQHIESLNCEFGFQLWTKKPNTLSLLVTITDANSSTVKNANGPYIKDLSFVFDNLPQSIFVIEVTNDNNYRIIDFNQTQLSFMGMNREDVQGKLLQELFPEEIAKSIIPRYDQCLEKRKQITYEEYVPLPDVGERWYLTTLTPLFDENDEIHTVVGNAIDITLRKEAERALTHEQKFKETLLDTATDGIVACDETGKLVLFNQTAQRWHGKGLKEISVEEAVEPYNLYHFDGVTPLKPHEIPLQRAFSGEILNNVGMAIKVNDEPVRYISTTGSPVIDKDGNKLGAVILMRDVTENLKQRKALQASEQKFKTLAYNTPGVIYLCENDEHYTINYINEQVKELTGISAAQFLENRANFVELYHPDDKEKIFTAVDKAMADQESFQVTYRLKHTSGEWKWILENGKGIYDDHGKLINIIGYLTDITKQRRAEEVAWKANQQLSFHLQNSPLAVIISDEHFNVKEWSNSAEDLFGWTEEEVLNVKPENWKFTHPEDQSIVDQKIRELVDGEKPRNLCLNRNYTKDGRLLHCEWYNSVMFDSRGKIISIFSLVHDITDRIEKEKELEDSLKEKNILLAEIHHRVKNNLAVVSGMIQLQAFETENEALRSKLFDSVVRIKSIATVHELLYQSDNFSDLNFTETISHIVDNISATLQSGKSINIDYQTDPVRLDVNKAIPAALVINEVVTNAFKHAFNERQSGHILFNIKHTDKTVEITITDDGVGIDLEKLESGHSLGIQLIKEITSQIYGTYSYTKLKKGTEFKLTFQL